MAQLNANWFVEGLQDVEHKKYVLLAYLQWIRRRFDQTELYPALGDLVFHYRNLRAFAEQQQQLRDLFPREVLGLDLESGQLNYADPPPDPAMEEVQEVVDYALPRIKAHLDEGKDLYEWVDELIGVEPVGVLPLNREAGYLLFRVGGEPELLAYEYRLTVYEQSNERYRGLRTRLVERFRLGLVDSPESVKLQLIRSRPQLPNPATYLVEARFRFPEEATLLPIARRKLMRYLADSAA